MPDYIFPPIDILQDFPVDVSLRKDAEDYKQLIKDIFESFGVKVSHIDIIFGPVITLYEIFLTSKTTLSDLEYIKNDIYEKLSRIENRLFVETSKEGNIVIQAEYINRQIVGIKSILELNEFKTTDRKLPIAIGKTVSNERLIIDLASMSPILIGGASGQGKSVTLDAIICSLLYKKTPQELKFVLIDFKICQFFPYAKLQHHFIASIPNEDEAIVSNPIHTLKILNSLCLEMENRLSLLDKTETSNIDDYNNKIITGKSDNIEELRFLPDIIVIIDEYADLIESSYSKKIEGYLLRLISQSKRIGVHMIIATQRPSKEIITDKIKEKCLTQMAFRTMKGYSEAILDNDEADYLIGRGDMLLSNDGKMQRLQAAYIDYSEVEAIVQHISSQSEVEDTYYLPASDITETPKLDPLFKEVMCYVNHNPQHMSIGSLQRRFGLGYIRARELLNSIKKAYENEKPTYIF